MRQLLESTKSLLLLQGGDLGRDAEGSHSILSTNCLNLSGEGEGLPLPWGSRENAVRQKLALTPTRSPQGEAWVGAHDGRGWGTRTFWAGGDILYLEGFE